MPTCEVVLPGWILSVHFKLEPKWSLNSWVLISTKVSISVWRYSDSSFTTVLDICVNLAQGKSCERREPQPRKCSTEATRARTCEWPAYQWNCTLTWILPLSPWSYHKPMHSQVVQAPLLNPSLNPRILPLCRPRPHIPEPMCASSVKRTIVTLDSVPWDTPLSKCYSRLFLAQLLLVPGPQPEKSSATESQTILATTTLTIWQAALPQNSTRLYWHRHSPHHLEEQKA